jgi:adenylate cyclase
LEKSVDDKKIGNAAALDFLGILPPISGSEKPKPFKGFFDSFMLLDNGGLIDPGRVAPREGDLSIGKGRRLNMAILFLDICGFSGRLSETEEEQELVLKALNLFFPEMIRVAEKCGGTIEKHTGDGLLVWFEDAFVGNADRGTERALKTAIEMIERNRQFVSPALKSRGIEEITFRVAIDYGPVTIASLGSPKRFRANVVIGTKANIACKLLKLANGGDIVLGDVARQELPATYQIRLSPITSDTGWEYRLSKAKYPAWVYR